MSFAKSKGGILEPARCDANREKAVQMTVGSLLKMKKNPTRPQNVSLHFPSAERKSQPRVL